MDRVKNFTRLQLKGEKRKMNRKEAQMNEFIAGIVKELPLKQS